MLAIPKNKEDALFVIININLEISKNKIYMFT